MPKVNPNILKWARETAGLSLQEAVDKIGLNGARGVSAVDRLINYELGDDEPSRPLLLRMAKRYHRPLLTFYMPYIPLKGDRGIDFRTLPEEYTEFDNANLDVLIRDVEARQSIVRALIEDEDEVEPLFFVGSSDIEDGIDSLISSIYEIINITKDDYRLERNQREAFKLLRRKVEEAGVYVLLISNLGSYHTTMDVGLFRGYSIADDLAPFIIINDQDAKSAWSFSLLHELVHICLGQTGISNDIAYTQIEKFCNDVAGKFLLSDEELDVLSINDSSDFEESLEMISDFSSEINISSTMVSYRLYRKGAISYKYWDHLRIKFRELWIEKKKSRQKYSRDQDGSPSYYVLQKHRTGSALITSINNWMNAGLITTTKAGKVLGVKPKNVQKLIESVIYS
ncbi:MAG: XRE family transcriptional regulator [Candidatus Krumholzibacteriota bacterium]|nr:XRE family transcriptional regulator [Candidatus Krumholzibacteriota bacterium]